MSLEPPGLWIEQRGLQHRVYCRNRGGLPTRSYPPFYSRDDAEQFMRPAGPLYGAPTSATPRGAGSGDLGC